jgi:hypothetical protein
MPDEDYEALVNYLTVWTYPVAFSMSQRKRLRHKANQYSVKKGVLYKKAKGQYPDRKVLKANEVLKMLHDQHDHVLSGHQEVKRTYDKIRQLYYWPG